MHDQQNTTVGTKLCISTLKPLSLLLHNDEVETLERIVVANILVSGV